MVQEMARLQVRDIRVRRHVLDHLDQVSKVDRCHYIDVFLREALIASITDVTVETLVEAGIIKNPRDGVKILGNGELTKKLNVKANAFSKSAAEKIEALGGKAEVM